MRDNQLPFSLTPTFVVITSLVYTSAILLLAIFLLVPSAGASTDKVFSNVSNAQHCADAARLAVSHNYVDRKGIAHCNIAIRSERLKEKGLAITYNNRGVLYKKLDKYSSALSDYYRARNIDRDFIALYINIGNIYFGNQDLERALKYYDRALSSYLKSVNGSSEQSMIDRGPVTALTAAYTNRGMVNEKLGFVTRAMNDYRAAIEWNPTAQTAQARLQSLQLDSHGLDAADINKSFVLQAVVGL